MKNEGEILCCDLHARKLSLVKNGAKKLGIDIIKVLEQDAGKMRDELCDSFDRVLCDVPCSGLGVIAKKPDIKYKPVEQIYNLPEVQLCILKNCANYVKVGGELVYSTCTLNAEENEMVVNKFLSKTDKFERVEFTLGDIKSKDGMFTFMPHLYEADGFFVAKMKRVK
jgi:16S rRNA (cytosine967-C5)-methyltransferase